MKVVSDTTKTVKYRTRKLKVRDYTITESYTDGVLTAQAWSVKGGFKTTHPGAYDQEVCTLPTMKMLIFLKVNLVVM